MLEKCHFIAGDHVVPKIARVPGAHESFLAHSLSRYPVHEKNKSQVQGNGSSDEETDAKPGDPSSIPRTIKVEGEK